MNYLKENWQELCIVSIAVFVIGTIMTCTWKYSNYALYGRITTLESHTDTLAKMLQQQQYQLDVITEYIKTTAHQI
jgi:hypothetical protein